MGPKKLLVGAHDIFLRITGYTPFFGVNHYV